MDYTGLTAERSVSIKTASVRGNIQSDPHLCERFTSFLHIVVPRRLGSIAKVKPNFTKLFLNLRSGTSEPKLCASQAESVAHSFSLDERHDKAASVSDDLGPERFTLTYVYAF